MNRFAGPIYWVRPARPEAHRLTAEPTLPTPPCGASVLSLPAGLPGGNPTLGVRSGQGVQAGALRRLGWI